MYTGSARLFKYAEIPFLAASDYPDASVIASVESLSAEPERLVAGMHSDNSEFEPRKNPEEIRKTATNRHRFARIKSGERHTAGPTSSGTRKSGNR